MPQTVTNGDLERLLTKFGFVKRRVELDNRFAVVFTHSQSGAEVYLRDYQASDPVEAYKVDIVRSTLDTYRLLDRYEFAKALDDARSSESWVVCRITNPMSTTVTYDQLERFLLGLGFRRLRAAGSHVYFEQAPSKAAVVVEDYAPRREVPPHKLNAARETLHHFGPGSEEFETP